METPTVLLVANTLVTHAGISHGPGMQFLVTPTEAIALQKSGQASPAQPKPAAKPA